MVLSKDEITQAGIFFDAALTEKQRQPAGVDLTAMAIERIVGAGWLGLLATELPSRELITPRDRVMAGEERRVWELGPGHYLIHYAETVQIPLDAIAYTQPRSSLLRMGVTLHGAVWDPGYCGQGVGLLVVHNPQGAFIVERARVAQMVFHRLGTPVEDGYTGQYQGEGIDAA